MCHFAENVFLPYQTLSYSSPRFTVRQRGDTVKISDGIDEGPFPRARIRTVDGRVVGNAYPTHHPDCRPMSGRIFKAQEIDTGCRYRIKQGLISPRRAWDLVRYFSRS